MSPRVRKLVGGVGMIAFVLVYALVAMALADSRPVNEAPGAFAHRALCRARPRLGPADDAAHRLDGARRAQATLSRRPRFHSTKGAPEISTSR